MPVAIDASLYAFAQHATLRHGPLGASPGGPICETPSGPGISRRSRGTNRGTNLRLLDAFQQVFSDGRLEVKKLVVDGPAAAVERVFAGTHDGVLPSPEGEVGATSRSVEFRWAAVYAVDGDELSSGHLFFDQADLLGQLGRLPT